MPVITINGPIGCGSVTVGQMVSQQLNINFVDRLVFTQAARLVGTPVGALIDKEQRVVRFRDRLGRFVQTMLERSAVAGVSGEPYFGRGIETLPPETFAELSGESTTPSQIDDKAFLEVTTKVVNDLHRQGDVVIIGRGANVILANTPGVVHVGLLAPIEMRASKPCWNGRQWPALAASHILAGESKRCLRKPSPSSPVRAPRLLRLTTRRFLK